MSVPMWLLELHDRDLGYIEKRAHICSQAIAEKGDVLMYGSKKVGTAAGVFNRLAEGVACLLVITKHPVPFETLVFYPDGSVVEYDSEEKANRVVWPVQEAPKEKPSELEVVPSVCRASEEVSAVDDEPSSDCSCEKTNRQDVS